MCWSPAVTAAMVAGGSIATGAAIINGQRPAISLTLGYFTAMEGLQAAGYAVIDRCGDPANQTVTLLSYLHIVFQPFFINAFAMELVPAPVRARARAAVMSLCAISSLMMLIQLYPFDWAGLCRPGATLCGSALCTVSGTWHIAWDIPYNGVLLPIERALGATGAFPTYVIAVFLLPLFYGAWRFVVFHTLAGPLLASVLTRDPNEMPAIWCLFSIGLLLIALCPIIRRRFEWRATAVPAAT